MAKNRVIGRHGEIPWKMPSDLSWFNKFTMGKCLVMGRATWDSLPKYLKGRVSIVLTRDENYLKFDGAYYVSSVDEALKLAKMSGREIVVIGGESIYKLFLNIADSIFLTELPVEIDGDRYFPELDNSWVLISDEELYTTSNDEYTAKIKVYERKKVADYSYISDSGKK